MQNVLVYSTTGIKRSNINILTHHVVHMYTYIIYIYSHYYYIYSAKLFLYTNLTIHETKGTTDLYQYKKHLYYRYHAIYLISIFLNICKLTSLLSIYFDYNMSNIQHSFYRIRYLIILLIVFHITYRSRTSSSYGLSP